MTFDQIINFRKVIETGSITKAADELFLSRQGLRNSITRLEASLGAPLLERTKAGLVPTEFGRYFAEETDQLNNMLLNLEHSYERYNLKTTGTLKLLCTSMSMTLLDQIEDICRYFSETHPSANIEFTKEDSAIPITPETCDAYDVIVRHSQDSSLCQQVMLPQTGYLACVGRKNNLYDKTVLTMDDLSDAVFTTASCHAPIYEWLKQMNVPDSRIYFDRTNPTIKRALVVEGSAITFITSNHKDKYVKLFGDDARFLPMYPALTMQDSMFFPKTKLQEKDIVKMFYDSCRRYIANKALPDA